MASAIAARFFSLPASFANPSASSATVANNAIAPTPHTAVFTAILSPANDSQLHPPRYPAPLDEGNGQHPPATRDDNHPQGASGHPCRINTAGPSSGPPSSKVISRTSVRIFPIPTLQVSRRLTAPVPVWYQLIPCPVKMPKRGWLHPPHKE